MFHINHLCGVSSSHIPVPARTFNILMTSLNQGFNIQDMQMRSDEQNTCSPPPKLHTACLGRGGYAGVDTAWFSLQSTDTIPPDTLKPVLNGTWT
jgi:hypothetical protein